MADLRAELIVARKQFNLSAKDRARAAIGRSLQAVMRYISETTPHRPDILQPLRELPHALKNVDDGARALLFEPANPGEKGRRSQPLQKIIFRASAAVVMELSMRSRMDRKEAARMTAQSLNKLGYRDAGVKIAAGPGC